MLRLLLCLAPLLLLLEGCGATRETAKAVVMASQGVEGGELVLAGPEMTAAMADPRLPADLRAVFAERIGVACDLFAQARESLVPAINLLAEGKPVDTGTTAADAARDPRAFNRLSAKQAGRAEGEVQSLLWWRAAAGLLLAWGAAAAGSTLSTTLLGGGGAGVVLGGAALLVKHVLAIKDQVQVAMAAYAQDAAACDPEVPAELEAVKEEHARRQRAAGIHHHVAIALGKVKVAKAKGLVPA